MVLINFVSCVGCSYSFTGSSVPPHLKTIGLPYTDDRSGSPEPGLREKFSTLLTKKFVEDNSLRIVEKSKADALLETVITQITDGPAVFSAGSSNRQGESVTRRRITVYIQAVCKDLVKKKVMYEKQFSAYAEYLPESGRTGRDEAIGVAIEQIANDVLLDTVSGW
ncbi:MAG: LPS assembly lipoprotein LptE [Ignavibacteria bacterium]|nr:LPS assembly lipoprotein LptE [Ignavibacteria bacterium]